MNRHAQRATSICSKLLLTGTALALVTAGCGGGGSGGGAGGSPGQKDAAQPNLDSAPASPDASPDLGKDLATITGGAGGSLDVGLGGAGGSLDLGAGGNASKDATPDKSNTGGIDGGGTGGVSGIDASDAPMDQAAERGTDVGPSKVDVGSVDSGPYVCPSPARAWSYPVSPMNTMSWDGDGSLITGSTFYATTTQFLASPGGTPVSLTGKGSSDILVAKLDPSTGNPTWLITAGDPQDQKLTGVAATSAGVGVLGTFTGTLDIVTGSQIVNPGTDLIDFLAGLKDADGAGVWSRKVDLGGGQLVAIAGQQGKDYFVVCGSAMNAAANLSAVGTPGGGKDVVVAAVKVSDGTILWSKLFGGTMDQTCNAAALDDDGNAIFAGTYAGTLDFGLGALSPAPTGDQDGILWVAKLNGATGATLAAKSFGTANLVTPNRLVTDAQGNVVVTGSFSISSVTFGSTVLTPVATTSNMSDAFVAKLDPTLSPLWARRWGGSVAAGKGVAVDSRGMTTVVGSFRGNIDVGPGSTVLKSALSNVLESFFVTLDGSTGQTVCAHNYGDSASKGGGASSVAINRWATGANQDSTAIVGNFTVVIDFGAPTTALSFSSTTASGTYLVRM